MATFPPRAQAHTAEVIYQLDPARFFDSNGDGWGDLAGINARLDYIRSLGATSLWLLPFYPTPYRDGGYDITDHRDVDPRFGTLADFDALVESAHGLGLRVIVELVVQHTSDQHPWFQEARSDAASPRRDYYLWAQVPEPSEVEPVFPGVEESVWAWDEVAGRYYRHAFYSHEPDLNLAHPEVRGHVLDTVDFWLDRGVDGFRIDAVPLMVERARAAIPAEEGMWWLSELREHAIRRRSDVMLIGEVDEYPEHYPQYFGNGQRLVALLNFWLNNHLFLAMAREQAAPIRQALADLPRPPTGAHYANWLRNHDELDLERLSDEERGEVMAAFAPGRSMRIYGRGIRRRLAPMLDGDLRRSAMAHVLILSLPGIPVLRYGDEIGQGDDLDRPERDAVRTPMQWDASPNAGFTIGEPVNPPVTGGVFDYRRRNVALQNTERESLLNTIRQTVHARHRHAQFFHQPCEPIAVEDPAVLALRYATLDAMLLVLINLSPRPAEISLALTGATDALTDQAHPDLGGPVRVDPYGFRWLHAPITPPPHHEGA